MRSSSLQQENVEPLGCAKRGSLRAAPYRKAGVAMESRGTSTPKL